MRAIYKREVFSYFVTPIGYIYIGIFLALGSLIFGLATSRDYPAICLIFFR